ncbi:hypothetical protein, partial [Leifsonia shinshuensis]|uniref:hypothetical protein n=1 Tax=Leifsonia shinshuensis TaxID=150026 RepID=UPI0035E8E719
RDSDTYGLFDRDKDQSDMRSFYKKIERDSALKHPNTVKLHKLIVGFHREWYERYNVDYKDMTRYIMRKLEQEKGVKLDWVAAEHLKETSPHVHIAIKSTGEDDRGDTKRLKITREDIDWLKGEIDRYTGREQILEREQELDRSSISPDLFKDLTKEVDRLAKQGDRDSERARRQAEREERQNKNRDNRDR